MRRNDQKRKDHRLAYGLFAMVGAVTVAVGVALVIFKPVDLNPLTGCPRENTAPTAHTIILIDETDRLPRNELKFVKDLISTEYRWLPLMGRLTVRTIVSDPSEAEDVLSICRIADKSSTGGVTDNEREIAKRFQQIAGDKLDALFDQLAGAPEQDESPILESVAAVLSRTDFESNVAARRLVVVSDFAQHSDLYSMYGRRLPEILPEAVLDQAALDMRGVDVRFQYVRRRELSAMQGQAHKNLWTAFVEGLSPRSFEIGHGLLIGEARDKETWVYQSTRETAS